MRLGIFTSPIREGAPPRVQASTTHSNKCPNLQTGFLGPATLVMQPQSTNKCGSDLSQFLLQLGKCQMNDALRPGATCRIMPACGWGPLAWHFHNSLREGVPAGVQALSKMKPKRAQILKTGFLDTTSFGDVGGKWGNVRCLIECGWLARLAADLLVWKKNSFVLLLLAVQHA